MAERALVSANQGLALRDPTLGTAFQLHDLGDTGVHATFHSNLVTVTPLA